MLSERERKRDREIERKSERERVYCAVYHSIRGKEGRKALQQAAKRRRKQLEQPFGRTLAPHWSLLRPILSFLRLCSVHVPSYTLLRRTLRGLFARLINFSLSTEYIADMFIIFYIRSYFNDFMIATIKI